MTTKKGTSIPHVAQWFLDEYPEDDNDSDSDNEEDMLDVVLLPTNFRRSTMYPLLPLLVGVLSLSGACFAHPWVEYSHLAEGSTRHTVFRSYIEESLIKECRTTPSGEKKCEWLSEIIHREGGDWWLHTTRFLVWVMTVLAWAAFLLSVMQTALTWLQETQEEPVKQVPGVLLYALVAAILAAIAGGGLLLTLMALKWLNGGSASLGFFLAELSVLGLLVGARLAWMAAVKPAQGGLPWQVVKEEDPDVRDSGSEQLLYTQFHQKTNF